MNRVSRKKFALLAASAAVTGLSALVEQTASAANATWDAAPSGSFWNSANWDSDAGPGYTPVTGDALFFGTSTVTTLGNDFPSGNSFGGLTFNPGASAFTLSGNDVVLTGPITVDSGGATNQTINLNITGATALSMSSANSTTGNVLTLNQNLTTPTLSASGLNITATPNNLLTIASDKTLTVTGSVLIGTAVGSLDAGRSQLAIAGATPGTGALVVNGAGASMVITNQGNASSSNIRSDLNLTGLGSFVLNGGSTGSLVIGTGNRGFGSLALSNTANSITVGTIIMSTNSSGNGGSSTLTLGTGNNVINADSINLVTNKGAGAIVGTTGSIKIRGTGGTDADRANITLARRTNSGTPPSSGVANLNLGTMTADVKVGTLIVGTTSFTTGSLNANSAAVTLGNGTFDVNNIVMGFKAGTAVLNGASNFNININGGTFLVNNSFSMANTNSQVNLTSNVNLNGGTLLSNADITQTGAVATQANVNVNGGVLDMTGHAIGTSAASITLNTQSGTVQNVGPINGTGGIVMNGTGILTLAGVNTYTGGTSVNTGTLIVGSGDALAGGTVNVAAGATAQLRSALPKAVRTSGITSAGTFDVNDGKVIVDYPDAGPTPLASIQSQITSGYASGAWNGPGINSSKSAVDSTTAHKTAIGYGESAAVFGSSGGTFGNQTVDGSAVLARYTYSGDANLDGTVDTVDFNALASNFGGTGKVWTQADFNYDGIVDTLDFNLLASNFGQQLSDPAGGDAGAVGSLVPEPATMTIPLLLAGSVLMRRRKVV